MTSNSNSNSKFISLILRHQPEIIGLELDSQGWAWIDQLIAKANQHGKNLNHALISQIVQENDKQRFSLSEDGLKIRANQGHSLNVDLNLVEKQPPEILYHGTATRFLDSILAIGLKPQTRQHVHLSRDKITAVKVGQRHGKPAVLEIAALQMAHNGYPFYLSENQVWLTAKVPPNYITVLEDDDK